MGGLISNAVRRLGDALQLVDYAALRAYAGARASVYVTGYLVTKEATGIAGMFVRDDGDAATVDNGGTVIVAANGKRWKRQFDDAVQVDWFEGADRTGGADSTAAIQGALNASRDVILSEGVYLFSALTVKRNTRLRGASMRSSVLKHTGAAAAIVCADDAVDEIDGRGVYVDNGGFVFEDFELMVNGTFGFRVGKTRSTLSRWKRVYIRHRRDLEAADANNQYFAGSVAIDCDNTPWQSGYASYLSKIEHCFVRGFETAVNLQDTVNGWELTGLYTIECKKQVVLSGATGINLSACYFESGIAGAMGVTFLAGGGNGVRIDATTFELTNAAGTQYAYAFAGGAWENILVSGAKYLIHSDGNSVNSRRISGVAPVTFTELNRSYDSATNGKVPMLWAPGATNAKPFQLPNFSRFGGFQQSNGKIKIARGDSDGADHEIAHDGVNYLLLDAYDGGLKVRVKGGVDRLVVEPITAVIRPGADNVQSFGTAAFRISTVYAGTATINTSDEREKQQIGAIEEAVFRAWGKVEFCRFKFNDAVADKGADGARWHFGVIAQRVKEAFESEGLDPFEYGVLCHDAWEGGDRYGVRYEEALALECAYLRRRIG